MIFKIIAAVSSLGPGGGALACRPTEPTDDDGPGSPLFQDALFVKDTKTMRAKSV